MLQFICWDIMFNFPSPIDYIASYCTVKSLGVNNTCNSCNMHGHEGFI